MVEIYWDDLTEEKQREILEVFGDNQNFDQFPIKQRSHKTLTSPFAVN